MPAPRRPAQGRPPRHRARAHILPESPGGLRNCATAVIAIESHGPWHTALSLMEKSGPTISIISKSPGALLRGFTVSVYVHAEEHRPGRGDRRRSGGSTERR
jgi:hypothetical protein